MNGPPVDLTGVILAGGRSRRMGSDKALMVYAGEPQIARTARLLASVCPRLLVSVRPDQARVPPYAAFELVIDGLDQRGPVAGLLAAWERVPDHALLVVAVDMPSVDEPLLRYLLQSRDRAGVATAFEHADGTPEPLCTIWEPAARAILRARARNSNVSLRRVLESSPICRIAPPDPASIRSVNTQQDYALLRGRGEL
jgi:molybdopterin-guanine dinucleotide biosynthesis protein A